MSLIAMRPVIGHWRLTLAGISGALIVVAVIVPIAGPSAAHADSQGAVMSPRQTAASTWLTSEGIDPSTLAAAGVTAVETTSIVNAAKDYIASSAGDNLAASRQAVDAARHQLQTAEAAAKKGTASAEAVGGAKVALASAESQFNTLRTTFRSTTLAGLLEAKVAVIDAVRRNKPTGLPVQYLVMDRSSEDALKLRDALADARIAAQREQSVPVASQTTILEAGGATSVITAKSYLDSNLATIRSAWASSMSEE